MRIAILTDAWHPQTSGVVTTLARMTEGLKGRGHEVLVVHPGMFPTVRCPTYPEIRLALAFGPKFARIVDAFGPEAIHIPVEGPLGLFGRHYCRRRGLPFTTSFTTKWPDYLHLRFRFPPGLLYRMLVWFHGGAARTTVAAPSHKEELEDYGFRNLAYWGRGVDTETFRPYGKGALDLPRPVAAYMGRVAVEKNIEAFLKVERPGSKVVIGPGPDLEKLRAKYPDVQFLGPKYGEDLARHLSAADVFVFPSRTDTFGIVMIEAMACGVPVAAFPAIGPRDVVLHGRTGWLSENLAEAMDNALRMDPDACRARAMEFSWERSLDQFEAMLEPIDTARSSSMPLSPLAAK